jgi:peptidoglycan/LPS O-acetylase OafA/YrhL
LSYRKEIDGLRAIAVVPVIFFHAGIESFKGGFVGVDVFFVISGYLITGIILKEIKRGTFSILNFYERRARRILPALFLVIFITIPFAWTLMSPAELKNYGGSVVSVPLFVSNLFFWRREGYFETANSLSPLLHTWSLAVEEQFYLFYPILFILIWKIGRKYLVGILSLILLISFLLAQIGSNAKPDAAFYLLPTRGWELLIGAIAALYTSNRKAVKFSPIFLEIFSYSGLFMIFFSVFTFNNSTQYPSVYTLIPTLGTMLIIIFATLDTFVGRFLTNRLLVAIGLISYSAYLWHQPVFVFARYWKINESLLVQLALVLLVFGISLLSWHYVEKPFRLKSQITRKSVVVFAFTAGMFLFFVGTISSQVNIGIEKQMAETLSKSEAIYSTNINERMFIEHRIGVENANPDTVIIGSSRVMQIGNHNNAGSNLNLAVSGASVEDILAIAYLATDKYKPVRIYISADPWLFNSNSGQNRWEALSHAYTEELGILGVDIKVNEPAVKSPIPFNQLLSRIYTEVNVNQIEAPDANPELIDKIRKDGSRVYNIEYENSTQSAIELEALNALNYAMLNYKYSEGNETQLEFLLRNLKDDYRVFLILSPYHPKVYKAMQEKSMVYVQIEQMYKDIATRTGVQIVGSYNPAQVGCNKFEFYDGMHPKGSCMKKLLEVIQEK